jgi:hypothetical protein
MIEGERKRDRPAHRMADDEGTLEAQRGDDVRERRRLGP